MVDSIARKTDRVLNKGYDMVVCFPGAKRKQHGFEQWWICFSTRRDK